MSITTFATAVKNSKIKEGVYTEIEGDVSTLIPEGKTADIISVTTSKVDDIRSHIFITLDIQDGE